MTPAPLGTPFLALIRSFPLDMVSPLVCRDAMAPQVPSVRRIASSDLFGNALTASSDGAVAH
jgi:hypothetical protein